MKGAERDPGQMALGDHLRELRKRLFICLIAVAVALIPAWFLYPWLTSMLNQPYCDAQRSIDPATPCKFLETNTLDPFTFRMRVAGWGALIIAMPIILWQIWRFIAPGLYKNERRYAYAFVGSGLALFALGAALSYITLTYAVQFLVGVAGPDVEVRAGVGNFTKLALLMMVAFGVGLQFPLIMVALQMVGILTPQKLASWRRPAILLIVVIAAGITPSGDPFSLFALAIPMYLLFEVSIVIGRLIQRRRRKRELAATKAAAVGSAAPTEAGSAGSAIDGGGDGGGDDTPPPASPDTGDPS